MSKPQKHSHTFIQWLQAARALQLFYVWLLMNVFFSLIYLALSYSTAHGPTIHAAESIPARFLETTYFTFVTTFTIGYGDVVPQGFSKILIMMQSLLAMLLMVSFTTKIISKKQDETLHAMHTLIDSNTVRHVREELFIMRKDFERIVRDHTRVDIPPSETWELAETASYHALVLVDDIQDILRELGASDLVTNRRREQIIFESLYRTIHRTNVLLQQTKIPVPTPPAYISFIHTIHEFVEDILHIATHWHAESPFQEKTEYDERVILLSNTILAQLSHIASALSSHPRRRKRPHLSVKHSQNNKHML